LGDFEEIRAFGGDADSLLGAGEAKWYLPVMREADHFYSVLEGIKKRSRVGNGMRDSGGDEAKRAFDRLVQPVVGEVVAADLFGWWSEKYGAGETPAYDRLGHIASFVLGDFDDAVMELDADDWSAIRDALAGEAEDLDLDILARLMTELVSRGALD